MAASASDAWRPEAGWWCGCAAALLRLTCLCPASRCTLISPCAPRYAGCSAGECDKNSQVRAPASLLLREPCTTVMPCTCPLPRWVGVGAGCRQACTLAALGPGFFLQELLFPGLLQPSPNASLLAPLAVHARRLFLAGHLPGLVRRL